MSPRDPGGPGRPLPSREPVDPDSFAHPHWCDRAECNAHEEHGEHRSTPRRIDWPGPGFPRVEVAFWQDAFTTVDDITSVELRLTYTYGSRITSVTTHELHPQQMRDLAAMLAEEADRVDAINAHLRARGGEPGDR